MCLFFFLFVISGFSSDDDEQFVSKLGIALENAEFKQKLQNILDKQHQHREPTATSNQQYRSPREVVHTPQPGPSTSPATAPSLTDVKSSQLVMALLKKKTKSIRDFLKGHSDSMLDTHTKEGSTTQTVLDLITSFM